MQWQLSPSVIAEAVMALGLLIVAIYFPWRDLNRNAGRTGSVLLICSALWILTHSLEIGTPIASYKAYLMGFQLIWGLLTLTLWLIYILHYIVPSGKWQTVRIYTLFGIMPLLAIVALITNNIYGLMWTAPGLNIHYPYLPLDPAYGLFYWGSMVYMGFLMLCGSFMIVKKVVQQNNFRRREPWVLILVAVIPLLVAFLEVTGVTMSANLTIGITPFFSGIGVIALVWTLPRFHLQKVIPVARHTVFERISDCVAVLNMQNLVVDLNPAAEHLAGCTSSEALGLSVEQIWPNWPSQLLLSKSASTVHEGLVLTCAGEQRTYNLHIYTIVDGKSRPLNQVALLVDITEHKREAEERRRLEEKAQIASRLAAVGGMAAGIAHEINNPLTGVLGFSKLLLENENLPEEIKDDLKVIADGSQRVADIVRRLLTFARQAKPVRTSVNLNELIDNTLKLRDYVLKTANIAVVTRFDTELPLSIVDPGQLQQVFLNLIVNAEQAMKEAHGKGTLTITTEKRGKNIRISFADDGPGITKENMARLFDPFFTTKAPGEGTGLGLGLSRSIVLEHGGELNIESEPGHGATFIIELPITEVLLPETDATSPMVKEKPAATKTGRILVVDDEPGVRTLIEKALTRTGHSVDTSGDPKEALDKLANASYDVLLTDIRMPGMSGMELYARVLEKSPAMANRIIFITGDTMGTDVKAFLAKNNLAYLAKPFDIEALKEKVDIILGAGQPENDRLDRSGR